MRWWKFVVTTELKKILAYRYDFWISFIGQFLVQIFISVALWKSIFEANQKSIMGGFSLDQIILYYILVPLGTKILAGENIGFLSREIYEGSFTRYLIYPISFFQYKTISYMTYSFFYALQLFLISVSYQLISGNFQAFEFLNLATGLFFFLISAFTFSQLAISIELISLWADNIWSLMVMARFLVLFLGGAYIPLNFFPEKFLTFLNYTPFPYFINLPIKIMMGMTANRDLLQGLFILSLWFLIFHFLSKYIWSRGQHHYTGVGI